MQKYWEKPTTPALNSLIDFGYGILTMGDETFAQRVPFPNTFVSCRQCQLYQGAL